MRMRVVTIVGARPQFVKAAALSVELRRQHEEILVHTGQHYDDNMSAQFFRELELPTVDCHLSVGPATPGAQTGRMLERLESVLEELQPNAVLVFGDTNSTLAGALAAAKQEVAVAHVEAGMRAHTRHLPEEINRVVTDRVSSWLFAPSQIAVDNLAAEGIRQGVFLVGDVMIDCLRHYAPLAAERSQLLQRLDLIPGEYAVATVHRAGTLNAPKRLAAVLETLAELPLPVVLPLHPHTAAVLRRCQAAPAEGTGRRLRVIPPLGYFDMLQLQRNARLILTDSGGMQKEAYYLRVPCVTLRDETEWVETVGAGWNRLAGTEREAIHSAVEASLASQPAAHPELYGDGHTARRIAKILSQGLPENVTSV
jgi:UDP-N-acetylglucosamine 2-epimerase